MRNILRYLVISFAVGALCVGAAFAGGGIVSTVVGTEAVEEQADAVSDSVKVEAPTARRRASPGGDVDLAPEEIGPAVEAAVTAPTEAVPSGTFLVGAARASLTPAPELFGGTEWQTEGCTTYGEGGASLDDDHVLPEVDPSDPVDTFDDIRGWPASSPDCIYLGGFGIGPVRPAQRVGDGDVWVRAIAISNGTETFTYAIADTVGWFARYDPTICSDCGILDVRERLAGDLGVPAGNVIVGSTHTHAGADTYGGWGGIPDWYRNQLRDAAIAASKQAVANMKSALITVGETHLRSRNNERRDTYYSTVDTGAPWLQATTLPVETCQGPGNSGEHGQGNQTCTTTTDVIATWATFAGHPTIVDDPILHADWPGAASRDFEARYGGVGLVFEGGLGNASISTVRQEGDSDETAAERTGAALASDIAASIEAGGTTLGSNRMAAATIPVTHPVATNPGLTTLGTVGLFDREFIPGTKGAGAPGAYHWSKTGEASSAVGEEDNDPEARGEFLRGCSTAGPTVKTVAGAHRIGSLLIAFAPGEIFSTIAEVVKERADRNSVAMVLGQTNDALGYIIQSFEFDTQGNAATEYGTTTGEYEEVFALDRCFGDHVLETILEATAALEFGR